MAAMNYQIEQNVPVPERVRGRPSVYPFAKMAVGDSFFVPGPMVRAARAAMYRFARLNRMRFASQMADGGMRIWRMK